jgi:hypothetical protein
MGFHDHGATRGECRGRVPAGHRECEGKITRAQNAHRPERHQHAPQIRPWRGLAIGQRGINAGIDPRTFADQCGESFQLTAGPVALGIQTIHRQPRLGVDALKERVTQGDDLVGDGVEKIRPHINIEPAVNFEGLVGMMQGAVDIRGGGFVHRWLESRAVERAGGVKRFRGIRGGFTGDDAMSSHPCSMQRAGPCGK